MNAWKRTMKADILSIIVLSASVLVLAACGGTQEEPRPVEIPARPTPTPVSTPTAPPTPTPTAEEASPRVPVTEWELDLIESTGRDLEALLPDSERLCIQEALGDQYEDFLSTPLATLVDEQTDKDALLGCWGPESVAGIALAVFADAAGGFAPETRTCLADVYRNAPDVVAALVRDGGAAPDETTFSVDMISCLTPEEAAALTPVGEGPPPDVDGLRCLRAELTNLEGGHEVMDIISSGDPAGLTQEQSALLGVAVEACGIETDFTFPDG